MDNTPTINHLMIFLGVFVTDVVYTFYLRAIYQHHTLQACAWASVVTTIGGVIIINYTASIWSIAAAAVGAFAGTFVSMKYVRKETS